MRLGRGGKMDLSSSLITRVLQTEERSYFLVKNCNLGRGLIQNSPDFPSLNSYIRWDNSSFITVTDGKKNLI
jgi:hypothetical protein